MASRPIRAQHPREPGCRGGAGTSGARGGVSHGAAMLGRKTLRSFLPYVPRLSLQGFSPKFRPSGFSLNLEVRTRGNALLVTWLTCRPVLFCKAGGPPLNAGHA